MKLAKPAEPLACTPSPMHRCLVPTSNPLRSKPRQEVSITQLAPAPACLGAKGTSPHVFGCPPLTAVIVAEWFSPVCATCPLGLTGTAIACYRRMYFVHVSATASGTQRVRVIFNSQNSFPCIAITRTCGWSTESTAGSKACRGGGQTKSNSNHGRTILETGFASNPTLLVGGTGQTGTLTRFRQTRFYSKR